MPTKRDPDRTYGQKLIALFARLLFSGRAYSLTELAEWLGCSKQTVLRLADDLEGAFETTVEEEMRGNRKYYRIRKPRGRQLVPLSGMEYQLLEMCHAFARHLLGHQQYDEVSRALLKSQAFLSEEKERPADHFASFRPGTIDYTPHQGTILTLLTAMEASKLCKVTYCGLMDQRDKTYYIQPLKLFSHGDTIYLHARKAKAPGQPYRSPHYDPLLAVHRIKSVELDDRTMEFPSDYDFEKVFQKTFGIIKQEKFQVAVQFSGWAARYVAERTWSPDQQITDLGEGKIRLTFSAASEPEVMSWVLSFGEEARVLEPKWLVENIQQKVQLMTRTYSTVDLGDVCIKQYEKTPGESD
ncbi:MAG: WYL domain-containing transcriptional regulator [Pseudomonadota bacterium]